MVQATKNDHIGPTGEILQSQERHSIALFRVFNRAVGNYASHSHELPILNIALPYELVQGHIALQRLLVLAQGMVRHIEA